MHKLKKILNALVEINRADLVHSIFVAFKIVLCSLLLVLKLHIFTCREAARSCRSVGRKNKKGLMDFETLKPLFLVLFGIILSSFKPV